MSDLPERITIPCYCWNEDIQQGTAHVYAATVRPHGAIYRLEKICRWRPLPTTGLILAVNHRPWELGEQPAYIKYCPICGGRVVIEEETEWKIDE